MDLQNSGLWIGNCDVKPAAMGQEPGFKRAICLNISKSVWPKFKDHAVHKNTALWGAGNCIIAPALVHS